MIKHSRIILAFLSSLLFFFSSGTVYAQWFNSSGSAFIEGNNIDKARTLAIKNAVKNALVFSGGEISNLQQVSNGVLVKNELVLNSHGEIKTLIITDEKKKNETLYVNIRVDIQADKDQCSGSNYPKSVATTLFKLNNSTQAIPGHIDDIDKKVSQIFYDQLKLSPKLVDLRQFVNVPTRLGDKYHNNEHNFRLVDTLQALARKSDSQYIIYGEINDLSVKFESKNSLSYWLINPVRNFYFKLYIYDALQGKLIKTKQYRTKAEWEYNKHDKADLYSELFWEYQYGQAIISLLNEVNADVSQTLQCQTPIAKIVSVDSNSVQINMGKRNGLTEGKILSISYSSNYKDQFGIERTSSTQYKGAMKVIELHEKNAVLRTLNNQPLSNIQINDIVFIR
jgi:hypothetical protein